jgi:hypothetical protein
MKFLLLVLSLLLPCGVFAEDLYHVRQLSEKGIVDMYQSMLLDGCRHGDEFWHDLPGATNKGYWGVGKSIEEGHRPNSGMVLASGALLKYSDSLTVADRRVLLRNALASLRFVTATHVTGAEKCVDGKQWGNGWQSAFWTSTYAFGAWLMWDVVDPALREDVKRVVVFEADRFLSIKPPVGDFNDTKAEENGWNVTSIALAAAMFPEHPHAKAWRDKATEYLVNTLSAPQDKDDTTIIAGRPLNEWFVGANLHPDFTLENHGIFHPSYVACSSYFLTQTMMYDAFARQPALPGADHHLMDTWRMFQQILLPYGEPAYPQSMDWELHNLPYLNLFAALATLRQDRFAARMEQTSLQFYRTWQIKRHGDLALPGSPHGFGRHGSTIDQMTYAFLAHKIFRKVARESSARQVAAQADGVYPHEWIAAIWQRTDDKFVSFSWSNHVMGMVIPIGSGHEGYPHFTAPIQNGFIGGFQPAPKGKNPPTVVEHSWKKTADGFETTGTLLLNGGSLRQTLRMTSLGDKTVVYQDRVTAMQDVKIDREHGVPIGIENDDITGGTRQLFWQGGQAVLDFKKPQNPIAISGSWANVDGRLGLVMVAGGNLSYNQDKGYQHGISIYEDLLYGAFSTAPKEFKKGDEITHRVAIVLLEASPKETAALAKSFKIESNGDGGQVLRFKPPGGRETKIPLL